VLRHFWYGNRKAIQPVKTTPYYSQKHSIEGLATNCSMVTPGKKTKIETVVVEYQQIVFF